MDNKVINSADSEIENTLMEAGDADARGQRGVKLPSDVTDWRDSLCVWL